MIGMIYNRIAHPLIKYPHRIPDEEKQQLIDLLDTVFQISYNEVEAKKVLDNLSNIW